MKLAIAIFVVLLGDLFALTVVEAANSCTKECREDYRACKQAHSEAACSTNRDICIKDCPK